MGAVDGHEEEEGDVVPLLKKNRSIKVVIDGVTQTVSSGNSAEFINIKQSNGGILIADSLTKKDSTAIKRGWSAWQDEDKVNRCFVVVSSTLVTDALQENHEAQLVEFMVGSWLLTQYEEACTDIKLYSEVKSKLVVDGGGEIELDKEELILSKYRFA
eukprot:scaffold87465_cov59-Attheya_sp.AAC.1